MALHVACCVERCYECRCIYLHLEWLAQHAVHVGLAIGSFQQLSQPGRHVCSTYGLHL
jgi:hypothetical protein